MAVRTILQAGDPGLKIRVRDIRDIREVVSVITDLTDTMRGNDLIGIAATQIGEPYSLFLTELRETPYRSLTQSDELRIYINPRLTRISEEPVEIYEGCGSVSKSGVFGPVERAREITVEAHDMNLRRFRLTCDGILARVIQHEVDHLNGIEFIEKITDRHLLIGAERYVAEIKNDPRFRPALEITKKEILNIP